MAVSRLPGTDIWVTGQWSVTITGVTVRDPTEDLPKPTITYEWTGPTTGSGSGTIPDAGVTQRDVRTYDQYGFLLEQTLVYTEFEFTLDFNLTDGDGDYTLIFTSDNGTIVSDTVIIRKVVGGPAITDISFTYPGTQTAIRSGQDFANVTVTTATYADSVVINTYGAAGYTVLTCDNPGTNTIWSSSSVSVSGANGLYNLRATATYVGLDNTDDDADQYEVDSDAPVITIHDIWYGSIMGSQTAARFGQSIWIRYTISSDASSASFVSINYYIPVGGAVAVGGPFIRPWTCISHLPEILTGTMQWTALKTKNNTSTILNVDPPIDNSSPAATMYVDGVISPTVAADDTYTVTLVANDPLIGAPTVDCDKGVWQGAAFTGSGTTWTRDINIPAGEQGTATFTITYMMNWSGLSNTTILAGEEFYIGGADILDISFTYPGTQTAIKSGQQLAVTVLTSTDATAVQVNAYEYASLTSLSEGPAGTWTGNVTITGSNSTDGTLQVTAYRGVLLNTQLDDANYEIDNDPPVISGVSIDYPGSQAACKLNEVIDLYYTIDDEDTRNITSSYFSIPTPTDEVSPKPCICTQVTGEYFTNTITITAHKNKNDTDATYNADARIDNTTPVITIYVDGEISPTVPNDAIYTVTISADDILSTAPSIDCDKGTWQGVGFTGSGTTWTRNLLLADDEYGTATFSNLSAINESAITQTTISAGDEFYIGGVTIVGIDFTYPLSQDHVKSGQNLYVVVTTTTADTTRINATGAASQTILAGGPTAWSGYVPISGSSGDYYLEARGTYLGLYDEDTDATPYTVSNDGPEILTIEFTYPLGQAYVKSGQNLSVVVTTEAADDCRINEIYPAEETYLTDTSAVGTAWSGYVPINGDAGSYLLQAWVQLGAYTNTENDTTYYVVNNDGPAITDITFTYPDDQNHIKSGQNLSVVVTTEESDSVRINAVGPAPLTYLTDIGSGIAWSGYVPITGSNGYYTLQARAEEAGFYTDQNDDSQYWLSNVGPVILSIEFTYPLGQDHVKSGQSLTVTVTTEIADSCRINGYGPATQTDLTGGPTVWTEDVEVNGSTNYYTLQARASKDGYNTTELDDSQYYISNEGPDIDTIDFTYPLSQDHVKSGQSLSVVVNMVDVADEVRINAVYPAQQTSLVDIGSGMAWSGYVPIVGSDGYYILQARAGYLGFYDAKNDDSQYYVSNEGPAIDSITFGYPGTQTAIKNGQSLDVTVTTATEADTVVIESSTAVDQTSLNPDATNTIWTGNVIIKSGTPDNFYTLEATATKNSYDNTEFDDEDYEVDNDVPVISNVIITYPATQTAVSSTQDIILSYTITDYTSEDVTSAYFDPITSAPSPRTMTCIYDYELFNNTVLIEAFKSYNDTSTSQWVDVRIDSSAPTATIYVDDQISPLVKGGTYEVKIISVDILKEAPVVTCDKGTWDGVGFVGSGTTWTRDITVDSSDDGTATFTLSMINEGGVSGTTIDDGETFTIDATPPIITDVDLNPEHPSTVEHGDTVTVTVTMASTTGDTTANCTCVFNASDWGASSSLNCSSIGAYQFQGTFNVNYPSGSASNLTGIATVTDTATNYDTMESDRLDINNDLGDKCDQEEDLIVGTGPIVGWLETLSDGSLFTHEEHEKACSEALLYEDNEPATAIIGSSLVQAPGGATADTWYLAVFGPLVLEKDISPYIDKDPFIWADGWVAGTTDFWPVDLSTYTLSSYSAYADIYINGDGSTTWEKVYDHSRDTPPKRFKTQIDLASINTALGVHMITDTVYMKIMVKTDGSADTIYIDNFGICYYGYEY